MWPKKPEEKAEDFAYADDPEFSTIRRKLARWAADNVRIIKDLKPPQPPGFNNRLNANWKLLLQIAQHAGGGCPEQARRSAIYLSRAPYEPSVGVQLLAALRAMFAKNRTEITSEQAVQELVNPITKDGNGLGNRRFFSKLLSCSQSRVWARRLVAATRGRV
jgi:hypothetical protein